MSNPTTTQVRVDSLVPGDTVRRFHKLYTVDLVDNSDFAWTFVHYVRNGIVSIGTTRPYATASLVKEVA